jgi:hypothetical protein
MRTRSFAKNEPAVPSLKSSKMRKGDEGFGAGNFRALLEDIERQQQTEGLG